MRFTKHILSYIISCTILLNVTFSSYSADNGNVLKNATWQFYPTATFQNLKICDTKTYTFILQQSRYYNTTSSNYYENSAQLFYIDKSVSTPEILPAADKWQMGGIVVDFVEYNKKQDYLLVVYSSGGIDILYGDGRSHTILDYCDINIPSNKTINSATFSDIDNTIYLATGFGFITIDSKQARITDIVQLNQNVSDICRIGDYLITFCNDKAYRACASPLPTSFSDFTKITFEAPSASWLDDKKNLESPRHLTPLAGNGFAFLAKGNNTTTNFALCVAFPDADGIWHAREINRDTYSQTSNGSPGLSTIAAVSPYKNGTLFNSTNSAIFLNTSAVPTFTTNQNVSATDVDSAIETYKTAALNIKAKGTKQTTAASWDGETMWWTSNYNDFSTESLTGGTPKPNVRKLHANAPLFAICNNIVYHDKYGVLFINNGNNPIFSANGTVIPALLFAYKDNKWIAHSAQYTNPAFAKEISNWSSFLSQYPVRLPDGLAIDPINENHIYVGSTLYGIARFDLANPDLPCLHLANPGNAQANLPGFIAAAPQHAGYAAHCKFTAPQFDSDNTMWTAYLNHDAPSDQKLELWYWTSSDRKASSETNIDATKFVALKKIIVYGAETSNMCGMVTLRHPDNKNMLFYYPNNYNTKLTFINHNGTPDNTSDDSVVTIQNIKDQHGNSYSKVRFYTAFEDTATGDVWVGCDNGIFSFKPASVIETQNVFVPEIEISEYFNEGGRIFEGIEVYALNKDSYGRLWVGTSNSGLYCLSPNSKEILAHFTTDDSDIPSNCVYGIGFNESDGSVFISTAAGIARLFPGGYNSANPEKTAITVTPSDIQPGYNGWITIEHLPDNTDILLQSSDNKMIRNIGRATDGVIQFRIEENGVRLSTDRYSIIRSDNQSVLSTFRVMQ